MVSARHQLMPELRHFATGASVTPSEDGAQASSYVLALRLADDQLRVLTIGRYDDQLVRLDGEWQLRVRRYVAWLTPELSDRAVLSAE